MENKQRAMKMGIRANGNLGQHFQKQASKWDPICSRAYCTVATEKESRSIRDAGIRAVPHTSGAVFVLLFRLGSIFV